MTDTIQKIADELAMLVQNSPTVDWRANVGAIGLRLRALSARASAGEGGEVVSKLLNMGYVTDEEVIHAEVCIERGRIEQRDHEGADLREFERRNAAFVNALPRKIDGSNSQPAQAGASGGGGRWLAEQDAKHLGTGYLVDGERVAPDRIEIIATPASPATGEDDAVAEVVARDKQLDARGDEWRPDREVRWRASPYGLPVGTKLYATPQPAAAQGVPTWFVSRCPGYPGGIDFRSKADALDLIRHHGNDETALHYWLHQAGRVDYTPEQTRAMLAAAPHPQDHIADADKMVAPPAHGEGEVDPDSASFKEGFSVGRAESEMMCELLRDPKCSRRGARNAIEAETLCRPSEDSCPGSEWPLSNIWALTTRPNPEARDAARYRWLRKQNANLDNPGAWTITYCDFTAEEGPSRYWVGSDLDAAIDAALALTAQGEG